MCIKPLVAVLLAALAFTPLSSFAKAGSAHGLEGTASYYGGRTVGRRTASGERYDPQALTAAHKTLPLGTRVRVTNQRNGRSVVVRRDVEEERMIVEAAHDLGVRHTCSSET